jgi:hypothetical protein
MTTSLNLAEREARLERAIGLYARQGYRVLSRTPTSASLVKPKQFSFVLAVLSLLLFGVGLLLYLAWYLAQKEPTVYLTVDEAGVIRDQRGLIVRDRVPEGGVLGFLAQRSAAQALPTTTSGLQSSSVRTCAACGATNAARSNYCAACGRSLSGR